MTDWEDKKKGKRGIKRMGRKKSEKPKGLRHRSSNSRDQWFLVCLLKIINKK